MKTYQDLLDAGKDETTRMRFVLAAIEEHKKSNLYRIAKEAEQYDKRQNTTIRNYQRILYTMTGAAVEDPFRANHKITSGFFPRFVNQQNQFLLGNGVTLADPDNKKRLGKSFDRQLQKLGHAAIVGGVSFGFWNLDHLDVFRVTEFVPLYDENNGALMAGIRFWQVAKDKPLRATLYELDGYTDYAKGDDKPMKVLKEKRSYILHVATSEIDGTEIYDGENYPSFPIIPLWCNQTHQSELVGIREAIDSYDLIKSGFANDLDQASMIYWILQNTGGMDDLDLARFLDRLHTVGAAVVDGDEGAKADAHTIDVPYQSRTAYLEKLEADLYADYQALDISKLMGGNKTATEIQAAYEPMNLKADLFEYCVDEFLEDLFELVGIDDVPTFNLDMISNQLEYTQMILAAAPQIGDDMVLKKLPWLSPEDVELIKAERDSEEFSLAGGGVTDGEEA